jgi:hypothetical protein
MPFLAVILVGKVVIFLNLCRVMMFLSSQQKFGALNITKVATEKLDVSGYVIFSNSETSSLVENLNEYNAFTEDRARKTNFDNLLGIGNLNLEYTPDSQSKWYSRTQVKRTNNANNQNLTSIINANTNTINTDRDLTATYINQNIEWHQRQNEKHTFSSVINYTFNKSDKTAFWETQDPILQGLIPADNNQALLRIN